MEDKLFLQFEISEENYKYLKKLSIENGTTLGKELNGIISFYETKHEDNDW